MNDPVISPNTVIGILVFAIIVCLLVGIMSYDAGRNTVYKQAVERGVGRMVQSANGLEFFVWDVERAKHNGQK